MQVGRITLFLVVVYSSFYGFRRSELDGAASEACSTDFEDPLRYLILTTRNQSVAAVERVEEVAIGEPRSSVYGFDEQAAGADVEAATTDRAYLALLEQEGLIAVLDQALDGPSYEDLLR